MKNRITLISIFTVFFMNFFYCYTFAASKICDIPVVEHPPMSSAYVMTQPQLEKYIKSIETENKLSNTKAKGVAGELIAREQIEAGLITLQGLKLKSIMSVFSDNGCSVERHLRNASDNGIDDILVVIDKNTGWIDRRYTPIFHEAKFNGRCAVKLSSTKTLCDQLSVAWIKKNLEEATRRTGAASICFGDQNELVIQSCISCKSQFQDNLEWLASQLKNGKFSRTVSVLCANGRLSIFNVK